MANAVNVKIKWSRAGGGIAPTITSPAFLVTGTVSTLYPTTTFTANGTSPITWGITSGALPTGLTFSSAGVLSGTPTTTASGSITFAATNAYGSDSRALTLTVGANPPNVITSSLNSGTVNVAYSFTLTASVQSATWTLQSGTLPAGLSLSPGGIISGTPTSVATASGLVFRATNSSGSGDSSPMSLSVNAAGAFSTTAPYALTDFLPEAVDGSAYSFALSTGGSLDSAIPYTWASVGAPLPAGFVLYPSGNISGTPSGAQKITGLQFSCTNSTGTTTTVPMTLVVRPKVVANRPDIVKLNFQPVTDYTRGEFQVERSTNGGGTWTPIARRYETAPVIIDYAPVTGAVQYRSKCINDVNWNVVSATVPSTFTAPAAVSGVTVSDITATTAVVSWGLDVDSTEDYFIVSVTTDGGSTYRELCRPRRRNNQKIRVVGLVGGTSNQQIRVVAVNPGGSSAGALSSTFATPAYSGSAPVAADSLTAIAADSSNIHIQFHMGDLLCEGSVIEISTDGGSTYTQKTILGKQVWQAWLIGLSASTSYKIRVRRFGSGGYASYSNVVTVSTLASGAFLSPANHTPFGLWNPHLHNSWVAKKNAYDAAYAANGGSYNAAFGANRSMAANFWYWLLRADAEGYAQRPGGTYGSRPHATSYEEYGFCSAILYMMTGNTSYAVKAFEKAYNLLYCELGQPPILTITPAGASHPELVSPGNTDDPRQYSVEAIQTMNMVYQGLDATRQATVRDTIRRIGYLHSANQFSRVIPTPLDSIIKLQNALNAVSGDSDYYITSYFAIAAASLFGRNSENLSFLTSDDGLFNVSAHPYSEFSAYTGGFNPQKNSLQFTMTSASFGEYAKYGAGGTWFESSQYDKNTLLLVATNLQTVTSILSSLGDNTDYHSVIRCEAINKSAKSFIYQILPNYAGHVQYNDSTYESTSANDYAISSYYSIIAGYTKGVVDYYDVLRGDYDNFININSTLTYAVKKQFYFQFDTSTSSLVNRASLPLSNKTDYSGRLVHRDGWGIGDSMYWFEGNSIRTVDHQCNYMADVQLHRKGIWATRAIASYGDVGGSPRGRNSVGIANHGFFGETPASPFASGGIIKHEWSGAYNYALYQSQGVLAWAYGFRVPNVFNLEYTRAAVYLPSTSKTSDCIILVDRSLASNPKLLGGYEYFPYIGTLDTSQNEIDKASALFEWNFRCLSATQPSTPSATKTTWTLLDNQQLGQADHLFPASFNRTIIDEKNSSLFPVGYGLGQGSNSPQLKYKMVLTPTQAWPTTTAPVWNQFLNVVSFRDSGASVTSTGIQSSSGNSVIGAVVNRSSENDAVLLFCATPATFSGRFTMPGLYGEVSDMYSPYADVQRNRDITTGFTIAYTQSTSSATIYAHDLLTTKSWNVFINGGAATPLTVSSNGVATFTVSGAGAKSLVFAGV
jgi:hypothetical protein